MKFLGFLLRLLPAIAEGVRRYFDRRTARAIEGERIRAESRAAAEQDAAGAIARADAARSEADTLKEQLRKMDGEP